MEVDGGVRTRMGSDIVYPAQEVIGVLVHLVCRASRQDCRLAGGDLVGVVTDSRYRCMALAVSASRFVIRRNVLLHENSPPSSPPMAAVLAPGGHMRDKNYALPD
jgi:hypothetical protein